jgi:hypothetical protein
VINLTLVTVLGAGPMVTIATDVEEVVELERDWRPSKIWAMSDAIAAAWEDAFTDDVLVVDVLVDEDDVLLLVVVVDEEDVLAVTVDTAVTVTY